MKVHEWLFQLVLDTLVGLWIIAFIMVFAADWPTTGKLWYVIPFDPSGVIHELAYMWGAAFASVYSLIWLKKKWNEAGT
ncbi:MAG: hypothetical protein V2A71_01990 [Candidatus Eisenbacteria bacterium]